MAQISPLLAFNLGLDHHLAPFLDVCEKHKTSSASTNQQSPACLLAATRAIVVQKKAGLPQSDFGRQGNVGIAKAMWLVKVRNPTSAIVGDAQHAPGQPDSSASHDGAGNEGEPAEDTATSSRRGDDAAAELVRALQGHFQEHLRCAATMKQNFEDSGYTLIIFLIVPFYHC